MSLRGGGDEHIRNELDRLRDAEPERDAERHAREHPEPPADDPRSRGVLARVRRLLGRRRRRSRRRV